MLDDPFGDDLAGWRALHSPERRAIAEAAARDREINGRRNDVLSPVARPQHLDDALLGAEESLLRSVDECAVHNAWRSGDRGRIVAMDVRTGRAMIAPCDPATGAIIEDPIRTWDASERARRLWRTEDAITFSTQVQRESLANWLGTMLHQPPLDRPGTAYAHIRALIEALWFDLADRTPDPLEPLALSPLILEAHPWGPGPDA